MAPRASLGSFACSVLLVVLLHSTFAAAFGAGNIASISAIEGQNWRHGDIEDTLLNLLVAGAAGGRMFTPTEVKRVYFGNWLRDYSQAVDVGALKYLSAEGIRLILWVAGFMSFGYGSGAFEVTRDRLGCYRPEEHIDNPKDYADNVDARQYDPRLRGPVDEGLELAIDPRTGLKNYIASEDVGITTSAGFVRETYGRCIELGRRYARTGDKDDLFEAFRLLGTANHTLEDFVAHSNYIELALREIGELEVFPFVGRNTELSLPGVKSQVYPVVTGTFGGVDFLYSMLGEFQDQVIQSELQDLEQAVQSSREGSDFSLLQELLRMMPQDAFGTEPKDHAAKAEELRTSTEAAHKQDAGANAHQTEAWTTRVDSISKVVYPLLEWHDDVMLGLSKMIEKLHVLPRLIEQLTEQAHLFVFSLLAPIVLPLIHQAKNELATVSNEIVKISREKQFNVFQDDACTDPTHSMLSKDHFSNVLNEPAGKVASQILKWVVPQIMACWDDEGTDVDTTLDRVVNGTLHHPALRDNGSPDSMVGRRGMYDVVEDWWNSKDDDEKDALRMQLSREGIEQGKNHKEGIQDSGHGSGKALSMPSLQSTCGDVLGDLLGISSVKSSPKIPQNSDPRRPSAAFTKGTAAGAMAGAIGGVAVAAATELLEGAFGTKQESSSDESSSSESAEACKGGGDRRRFTLRRREEWRQSSSESKEKRRTSKHQRKIAEGDAVGEPGESSGRCGIFSHVRRWFHSRGAGSQRSHRIHIRAIWRR